MPKLAEGTYLASMSLAMDRLAEYVGKAQAGDLAGLQVMIDANTQDPDRHPNQLILGAAMFLADFQRASGKSIIPLLKEAVRKWDAEGRVRGKLWSPD